MSRIEATNIAVDFPVYDNKSRSLRHKLILDHIIKDKDPDARRISVGGRIVHQESGKVVIRALEDLTFSLKDGDRLGLLGHNGAGKSTLLKVLAKIYEPIAGAIEVEGTITPMFNLSDGMDPDSTGYENIWLRGRVLGFTDSEILGNIDDIAAFTDLGEYLHMPIRTYSSGMMVRLSFAIATAVQPDILIMDEMIGAGDATFIDQANKRLRAFVQRAGIMVVATHSLDILREWCNSAMLLHHGRIETIGDVEDVIARYKEMIGQ